MSLGALLLGDLWGAAVLEWIQVALRAAGTWSTQLEIWAPSKETVMIKVGV